MGKISKTKKVKLIVGMIAAKPKLFKEAAAAASRRFGAVDYESPVLKFDYTDYYKKELGSNLKRRFISFKRLIRQDELADIKTYTNRLEGRFGSRGKRKINLDPGYVSTAKLVLATTKDHTHRVYLGKGIYAEVTLHYRNGTFEPWEWTYPDYKTKEYISIFNDIRRKI